MFTEEMQEKKEKEEKEKKKNPEKNENKLKSKFKKDGERRMCNEIKCEWTLNEYDDPEFSEIRLNLPKFLDTKKIEVELLEEWVSIKIENKLFQMKLWEKIYCNPVKLQRSATTGELYIQMRKLSLDPLLKRRKELEMEEQEQKNKEKFELEKKEREAKEEAYLIKKMNKKKKEFMEDF